MDKMHLKIVEETEWDAAGELGYVIQAAQNMRIIYFNALAKKKIWYPITVKKYTMAARMQAVARHRRPFLL